MKLTTFLLLVALMEISAHGYSQTVSISEQNLTLARVFRDIHKQTGYNFLCTKEQLLSTSKVNLDAKNTSLKEVLDICFRNQPLTYTIINRTIIVKRKSGPLSAQMLRELPPAIRLTGTIKDSITGKPLAGTTIQVKGSTIGTTTDNNGNYALEIPQDAILIISALGYKRREISVGNATTMNILLGRTNTGLDEVVVTALGIKEEKRKLAYAVSELGGDKIDQAQEVNLGNALEGRIPGVNATSTATGIGGSSRILIRGNKSFSGDNQPLYVINGIPMDNSNLGQATGTYGGYDRGDGLNSINPDDIETISVLKGAQASALYGSRASNGVILITTKSGATQNGLGISLNSSYTLDDILITPQWQYQYGAGTRGIAPSSMADAINNGRTSWGARLDGSQVIQPDGESRPYIAHKDNFKNFYRTGTTFSNSIALIGGNQDLNFRASVSDLNNSGIVPNSSLERNTFNLNVNANISNKITFEGTAQYAIIKGKGRSRLNDYTLNPNASVYVLSPSIDIRTLAPGYDENGYETPWNDLIFATNPYFATSKVKSNDEQDRFIGSLQAQYNITDYLYIGGHIGIDIYNFKATEVSPTGALLGLEGNMTETQRKSSETNIQGQIGFNKTFNSLSLDILVGGDRMFHKEDGARFSSGLFNVPFKYFISNGTNPTFSQQFSEMAVNSLFGSVNVGFKQYLYATFTGRQEWFSTLSKQNNTLFYPSVGISFIFSELLSQRPSWLTSGKLRASWAEVGGGAPSPYALNLTYVQQSTSHLGHTLMSIGASTVPNGHLKPYTSNSSEVGLDLNMLDNRLQADLSAYRQRTSNDIVSAVISTSAAYNNVLLNVGKIENKGLELALTGTPIIHGFTWTVSYNLAYNHSKIIEIAPGLPNLAVGSPPRSQNGFIYQFQGMPYGMVSGYRAKSDEQGNIIYDPSSGAPEQSDLMPLGKGVPPLTMGITNGFSYKAFSLSFLIDGKFGGSIYSGTNANAAYFGLLRSTTAGNIREDGVELSGVDLDGKPFTKTISAQDYFRNIAYRITDEFVYDADFIKLRQVILSYNFPKKLIDKVGIRSASISLIGRNILFLYNEVPNIDPESAYNSSNAQGLESFGIPTTRSLGVNLQLKF